MKFEPVKRKAVPVLILHVKFYGKIKETNRIIFLIFIAIKIFGIICSENEDMPKSVMLLCQKI